MLDVWMSLLYLSDFEKEKRFHFQGKEENRLLYNKKYCKY